MADASPRKKERSAGSGGGHPSTWWQWIMVYPALAIALFTAAPAWMDAGKAYFLDLDAADLSEAEKLKAFMEENLSCLGAPERWVENPDNILVDGTICNSGDIMIKVQIPKPDDRVFFRGISLSEIMKRSTKQSDLLGLRSYAATRPEGGYAPGGDAGPLAILRGQGIDLAQQFSISICQKIVDDRTILRHVKVGDTCYDEFIDTYTGEMKNRVETPCRTTC